MKSFKDLIQGDNNIFINPKEFGVKHLIDGIEMNVIIDNNEMLERETRYKVHDYGLFKKQLLIYVLSEEIGPLPAVGRIIKLDRQTYKIIDAINEDGIYSITLEANKS